MTVKHYSNEKLQQRKLPVSTCNFFCQKLAVVDKCSDIRRNITLPKMVVAILISLLLLSTASAYRINITVGLEPFPRTELPEEGNRVFKIGPYRHYWISCATDSMAPTLSCNSTYWAYSAGFEQDWTLDVQVGDIIAYKMPKDWRDWYYKEFEVRIRYVIHRIIGKNESCWITKGDNNQELDDVCVTDSMIQYVILWEETDPSNMDIEVE